MHRSSEQDARTTNLNQPTQYCSVKRVWGVWGVWEVWEVGEFMEREFELIRAVLGREMGR
ncbi:MAG: hypothetical protein F6K47_09410 [Symploca sp. SIO2E6]|nr:hypothetical protein [Symploca sp. SIO2E6]